jgi:uncharacterized OB-fold protein
MTLLVPVCTACSRAAFPPRLLCPQCGGAQWRDEPVEHGVLEGRTDAAEAVVGEVRLALGPVVVVRLECDVAVGTEVLLDGSNGVVVAR